MKALAMILLLALLAMTGCDKKADAETAPAVEAPAEEAPAEEEPAGPTELELLTEIRDALKAAK